MALVAGVGCLLACGGVSEPAEPPNLVLYVADTLRADVLAPYGNTVVETPNLARLAREASVRRFLFRRERGTNTEKGPGIPG